MADDPLLGHGRQVIVREDWLKLTEEPILEPGLPIIDPHHHLWDFPNWRYLFPDLLADLQSGHNIRQTVFVQCFSMYRVDGPRELRSLVLTLVTIASGIGLLVGVLIPLGLLGLAGWAGYRASSSSSSS